MAELIVRGADGLTSRHPLGASPVSIGRHPECDIVINDPQASRRHARIYPEARGYVFEDLKSANGSLLNGKPVTDPVVLNDGDRVAIGSITIEFAAASRRPETRGSLAVPPAGAVPVGEQIVSVVTFSDDSGAPAVNYSMDAEKGVMSGVEAASGEYPSASVDLVRRLSQRLETLVKLSEALATDLHVGKLLESIMDRLFETFPQSDRGFILLAGPGREETLTPQVVRNREAGPGEASEIAVSGSVIREARRARKAVLVSDTGADNRFAAALSIAKFQIRSVMCSPLIVGGEDMGVIYLDTKSSRKAFTPDDLALFTAVAAQAAVSLKVARLAEQAAREAQIRSRMQRYFPPDLVDKMIRGEIHAEPGGTLKRGTVFFSDIIGFSRMARRKPPADVINLLNRYFKVMESFIFDRGGTIDKFGGDAIMAFWGVLVDAPEAAYRAALAAVEMQNALYCFNWMSQTEGLEPIWMGIGLNTGEFVAGNVGSEQMVEYTVIGEAVNLAQRVESLAGRGQVLVTRATLEEFRDRAVAVALPRCPVKGYPDPIEVFSIRGLLRPAGDSAARPSQAPGAAAAETPRPFHAAGIQGAAGKAGAQTPSRGGPGGSLLLSIPAAFEVPGKGGTVRGFARAGGQDGDGFFLEVATSPGLQKDARVRMLPEVQEKATIPPLEATVAATRVEHCRDLGDVHIATLRIARPQPLHQQLLKPGTIIPSDLRSPDEIIRA
ncbi:MAG: FHA domain-containing protein [Planctomycetota bacterium]|nr:FHA domain-containing protein [Planctomycetota bacterium]